MPEPSISIFSLDAVVVRPLSIPAILCILGIYLLPAAIAYGRGHHNRAAILLLTLLLGWTGLGWVIALIWSATAVRSEAAQQKDR